MKKGLASMLSNFIIYAGSPENNMTHRELFKKICARIRIEKMWIFVRPCPAKIFIETILDWSPEELVFNAIAWKGGYRFFGCSRDLSNAMAKPKKKNPDYICYSTTMRQPDSGDEDKIIWQNPKMMNSEVM